MNSFWDYTTPNIFGGNFYLPQMGFQMPNVNFFSIWDTYNAPMNTPPVFNSLFDFQFSMPAFNFQFPTIQFPQINWSFVPAAQAPAPVQSQPVVVQNDKQEDLEPVETDVIAEEKIQVADAGKTQKKSAKTRASGTKTKNYPTVEEEIIPGYYVNKGKYLNIQDLKPYMKEALVKLDKKAKELGYKLVVIDGFRTHEGQKAAKKRKPKLCATPGKSPHEYGVAVDLALYDSNGKQISIDKVKAFSDYAQAIGLEWGATWKSKYEPWHFNMMDWQDLADVRNEYRQYNNLA